MKYEIDGIKNGVTIKNYQVKTYYGIKKLKLVKKYHFKINYLNGKSGNLRTTNIEDIYDVIKEVEKNMLKQLKELLKSDEIKNNSATKYLEKKLYVFHILSSVITAIMPTIFMIKYNNFFNILLIFPNLLAKFYYTISLGMDYTEEFYKDVQKYQLYLDNKKTFDEKINFININNIDKYSLETIEKILSDLKENILVKRR